MKIKMEKVKVNDMVVVDSVTNGTVKVLTSCENKEDGQWYCTTHMYRCPIQEDFSKHFQSRAGCLVGWICNEHGLEVP